LPFLLQVDFDVFPTRDDLTTNIPVTEPQLEGRSQRLKIGTLGRLAVSYGDRDVAVNTQ
jgi:hypothetical protein